MSWIFARMPALFVGLAWLTLASSARSAPCGRPDVDLTLPPNGADGVPANAHFAAHYAAPAIYLNESVTMTDADQNVIPLTIAYDEVDSLLRATPDQPLAPGAYDLLWPGLRAVSGSGGVGRGSTTHVTVTTATDVAAPTFTGLSDIHWDLARDRDPCLDRLDDRFKFQLDVGRATDDLPVEFLSLQIFETKTPGAPEPTSPSNVGLRAWPKDGRLELRRPATKAGQTCFAAIAQDLLGRVSGGGEHEVCVKTTKPPFFDGCAVARVPMSSNGVASGLALLALALLRRGRRADARKPRPV
jgi:hypothetical protein